MILRRREEVEYEQAEEAFLEGDVPYVPGSARAALSHRNFRVVWSGLRAACGDDAYERYLVHFSREHPGRPPAGRREFYRESEQRKWSGVSRCC